MHERPGAPLDQSPPLARRAFAEVVGAFFLTTAGAGIEIVDVLFPGTIDVTMKAVAPAAVVAAMIYSLGDISGAHLNPVVTATFAVRGVFEWRRVPVYWISQVLGAVLSAAILRALFGTVRSVGTSEIHIAAWRGCVVEGIVTALLVIVILNTAHKHSLIGTEAALAVGAVLLACGLIACQLTTASMNPARSLGPAIVSGNFDNLWVFIVGPFAGAAIALGIVTALRPVPNTDEVEAAGGS
jgi:aquaporin Z